jgi:2,3-bisphosphoglycerate-dependent phosphoglycerate mutase
VTVAAENPVMQTRVILLRHAETATPHVFHGAESDEVLSDHGHATAALAAPWLAAMNPAVVVTSAMRRTIQTAAPLLRQSSVPHRIVPELHERRVGILGGTPFITVQGLWTDTLAAWSAGDVDFTTDGAESYAAVRDRVMAAWKEVIAQYSGQTVVMIVHGIVVKILILTLVDSWGPTRWHELGKVANLATSILDFDDDVTWRLSSLFTMPPGVESNADNAATTQFPKSVA